MKRHESNQAETTGTTLVLVPADRLISIEDTLQELLAIAKGQAGQALSGYITEQEAMKLLGRKGTWFWALRKSGKLSYHKVGRTVYYSRADIVALIEAGAVESFDAKRR